MYFFYLLTPQNLYRSFKSDNVNDLQLTQSFSKERVAVFTNLNYCPYTFGHVAGNI